eukprot:scpid100598/ scgid11453/ Probable protein BRICK1-B
MTHVQFCVCVNVLLAEAGSFSFQRESRVLSSWNYFGRQLIVQDHPAFWQLVAPCSRGRSHRVEISIIMSSSKRHFQQDWEDREFVEVITFSIKKMAEFLNNFDMSARSRLATLNEKVTTLERRVDYIEARITKGEKIKG